MDTTRTLATAALAALASTMTSGAARAAECPPYTIVSYFEVPTKQLPDKPDSRCDVKDGKCVAINLVGYLFQPHDDDKPGAKPTRHPLIVNNHGSEQEPGPGCTLARQVLKSGYILFSPIRRGHKGVDGTKGKAPLPNGGVAKSSGAYYPEYQSKYCSDKNDANLCKMEYIKRQVGDLEEAITYLKKQPFVDPTRVAFIGHSFGGILTLLANTHDYGQRAVVAAGAGSESWVSNPYTPPALDEAVSHAVAPMFIWQPMNDAAIDSTIKLARTAGHNCRQYQSALFPAIRVPRGKDGKLAKNDYTPESVRAQAHAETMVHIDVWGSAVQDFIDRNLNTPAAPNDTLCIGTSHKPD